MKKKKLKLKKSVLFKALAFIVIILSSILFIQFLRLKILPFFYLLLVFVILGVIDFVLYFLLSKKNANCRMIGTVLCIVFLCLFSIGIKYQNATLNFLRNFSFLNIETENYLLIVKKNSSFYSQDDLTGKTISYIENRSGAKEAFTKLQEKKDYREKASTDIASLVTDLLDENVSAILLEKSEEEIYSEVSSEFKENHRVLETITVDHIKEDFSKDVEITKEPFSVYITGVDTYDKISSVARSDVNMVITVNPTTHRVLLTSIPRDYYVQIYNTTGLKDKLTHAGLQGVETSIKTIEELLDMDIHYYIKFNFTSLIQIVDAIGGIDVDSPFAFTADYEEEEHIYYEFQKGLNHLNGKQALAYVRERYSLREGDVARTKHQQQVVSAVVNKLTSSTILTKYGELLGSMEGNFTTNIDFESITAFIEMQLADMPSWTIETQVLSGSDASMKTASIPNYYSSVMLPDEESVKTSHQKIEEIINSN